MNRKLFSLFALTLSVALFTGCATPQPAMKQDVQALPDVKAGQFDTGRMWTFDFPPTDYFATTYSFNPTKEWFEEVRLSALRLPNCTASFVSEDGLVMTNHHCARTPLDRVNKEGEDLGRDGFYAPTLADERKVPGYYIDQLVVMEDVTPEIQLAFDSGTTDEEKVQRRDAKMREVQQRYADEYKKMSPDSMYFSVITFYNGGRYSVYGYRRYTDLRIVYAPETEIAFFGGDPDNFTYPRYNLDVSFFRIYDADGKPLKTKHFFKWSARGAQDGDAVFVIGNPGSTNRLLTVKQLEFNRDYRYKYYLDYVTALKNIYGDFLAAHPDKNVKYQTRFFSYSNSEKAVAGYLGGYKDPVVMAKKTDFENTFRAAVMAKPGLSSQYASVWSDIAAFQPKKAELYYQLNAYNYGRKAPQFDLAGDLVAYAQQMKLPEDQRSPAYMGGRLEATKARLTVSEMEPELQLALLKYQIGVIERDLAGNNPNVAMLLDGQTSDQAAERLAKESVLNDKSAVTALVDGSPDAILTSTDPILGFVARSADLAANIQRQWQDLGEQEGARVQLLGKALYEVYGTKIPPDANFNLRIADGVVKSYPYNGTIAPVYTTFYGLYDRYYSFGKMDPWGLTERWQNPPASFDMSKPINFVSTNDIIGGNSGSPVINVNREVVGLIFDGNIESLPGNIIFDDTLNRSVSVHSAGILEALEHMYQATRIAEELKTAKMSVPQTMK